jgi:outer membrane protein OmpA-like peptidoglycan-associated protein
VRSTSRIGAVSPPVTVTPGSFVHWRQNGLLQRKCACGQHTVGGEQCGGCQKKKATLQQHQAAMAGTTTIPPIVSEVLSSPGQPLDRKTRTFFEPRFGLDFSHVRVHSDARAADSASGVHAHAYTVGRDIVFGPGQYSAHADASRHLLAHELTHVVQQATSGVSSDSERVANATADRVSHGQAIDGLGLGGAPVSLQRSPKDDTAGGTGVVGSADNSTEPPVDEFGFDNTDIPPQHLAHLAALRARLLNAPSATVVLTGHTDTVGKEKYNEDLGRGRAKAVRDFLSEGKGVNPSRIEIKSRGELEPAAGQPPAKVDPEKGEKNPKNRRVEIQVVGLPSAEPKTDLPSDRPTIETPPPPGKDKPVIPGPGEPMTKELCVVYPDLCKAPDTHRLPPDFWKPLPPAPKQTQKSTLDLINENLVDPIVKAVTKGLPKVVQDKILELAHDGVEKGITSTASSAAAAAGLDPKAQQAIEKAIEGAIKYKGQQPGQEGGSQ